jgi:hypothetical protein
MSNKPIDTDELLCAIYNDASSGGPVATPDTLRFVQTPFLIKAVTAAMPRLSADAATIAQAWLARQAGGANG